MDKFSYHKVYSMVEDEIYGKKGSCIRPLYFKILESWKVEKFSYHRVYRKIEDEVYEKKGVGKLKNFRITKYTIR